MQFDTTTTSRRNFLGLIALAGASAAGLSACTIGGGATGGGGNAASADLQAWIWSFVGDPLSEFYIPGYEADNPGVTVEVPELGGDIWTKLTTGFAAGGAGLPDITLMGIDYIQNYIKTFPDGLLNLSSKGADEFSGLFADGVWEALLGPDGNSYEIPWWCDPSAMTHRQDYFEYAGVPDAANLENWDQLLDVGRKLKADKDVSLYAFNYTGSGGTFDSQLWLLLVQLQGSSWYTKDGKIAINNAAGVKAMEILKIGADEGLWASDPGDGSGATTLNQQGKLAIRGHVAAYTSIVKNEVPEQAGLWRVANWPSVEPGGKRSAVIGSVQDSSIQATSADQDPRQLFVTTFLTDPHHLRRRSSATPAPPHALVGVEETYDLPPGGQLLQ